MTTFYGEPFCALQKSITLFGKHALGMTLSEATGPAASLSLCRKRRPGSEEGIYINFRTLCTVAPFYMTSPIPLTALSFVNF